MLAFTIASIVFSINYSQLLYSEPRYSIQAFIGFLKLLQKYQIRSNFFKVPSLSNFEKID